MLSKEDACRIWDYDPATGYFFWKVSPRYRVNVGDRAGCFNGKYWMLHYRGRAYKAARVAWLVSSGDWPKDQIDHINGDRLDDRIINLREATNAENCRNRKCRSNNKSGLKGVATARYAFNASISKDGKTIQLGRFQSSLEAKRAYDEAALKLHGEFARL